MKDYLFLQAERCRRRCGTRDPYGLLASLGAEVRLSDRYPEDGLRGYCAVMNRTDYVVINAKLAEAERRVVAAHEAGHLVLHRDRLKVGALKDMDLYNAADSMEREANLFAADFLIDDADVLELACGRDEDFFRAASRLEVPAPFFAFKLYSMVSRGHGMTLPVQPDSTFLRRKLTRPPV